MSENIIIKSKDNSLQKQELKKELIEVSKVAGLKVLAGCLRALANSLGQASYDLEKILDKKN